MKSAKCNLANLNECNLWHTMDKFLKIGYISKFCNDRHNVCLTCALAKFTKLPYSASKSCAKSKFELIHIDI